MSHYLTTVRTPASIYLAPAHGDGGCGAGGAAGEAGYFYGVLDTGNNAVVQIAYFFPLRLESVLLWSIKLPARVPHHNNVQISVHEVFAHHFRLPTGARKWYISYVCYAFV